MRLKPNSASNSQRGFAIIVTVSILVLLAVVAVGLLTLSTVTVRAASQGSLKAEAQANARLALVLAIGDLQKFAGPDQRITASSGILDNTPNSPDYDGIENAHWTGVWESWKWNGSGSTPNYDDQKRDRFLGWLVSNPDPNNSNDLELPTNEIADTPVTLIDEDFGGIRNPDARVQAPAVGIDTQRAITGRYAWAVLDEGQKAPFQLPDPAARDRAEQLAALTAPSSPSYQQINGLDELDNTSNADRAKLISLSQLSTAGLDNTAQYFHDLTPVSTGLLTNVVDGGLTRDLSLLFDSDQLPASHLDRYMYSDNDSPLASAPRRFNGAGTDFAHPDPSWRLLHSHYSHYKNLENITDQPTAEVTQVARPPAGRSDASNPFYHTSQLAPVIAKAQFVFSISAGFHGALNQLKNQGAATDKDKYISWLVTDPVITLWNPHSVTIRLTGMQVHLRRVPLGFHLYKNGTLINAEPTHFANTFLNGDFGSRALNFYNLALRPEYGTSEIVLKPGEHKVFTAFNHVKHYRHQYTRDYNPGLGDTNGQQGLVLRPGFNAPAGNASNEFVGGVSTLNVCVNNAGSPSGRINGKPVRTVPLKAGDRLQLAVVPQRANIDKFRELGNKEITAYLTSFLAGKNGRASSQTSLGSIELDYEGDLNDHLDQFQINDLPTFIVPGDIPPGEKADNYHGSRPPPATRFKEPFLIASLQLKTEQDAKFPSRSWIQNSPTGSFSSAGLDQKEDLSAHQYEFTWEPMTDWTSSPTIEVDAQDRGFGAAGIYAQSGRSTAPFRGVPLAPAASLGELRHAPLNDGGQLPLTTQVVGNSFACPLLSRNQVSRTADARTFLDHSFFANNALFDRYFFSTAAEQNTGLHNTPRTRQQVLQDFLSDTRRLPNKRFRSYLDSDPAELATSLNSSPDGYEKFSAHLLLDGAFNVNSTSVTAWRAFLASASQDEIPLLDALTGSLGTTTGQGAAFSRFTPPASPELSSSDDPDRIEELKWAGYRRLNDEQLQTLAEAIVEQVKLRGPFQSLAEFVNRRVESSDLGLHGTLQAAIDQTDINDEFRITSRNLGDNPEMQDPEAAAGLSAEGAPAFLNQADLLTPLAPIIAVRSDTFRIRAYGEASDASGKKVTAVCEAVVQRIPDYLDSSEPSHADASQLDPGGINIRFGRRIKVNSFRWLSEAEL